MARAGRNPCRRNTGSCFLSSCRSARSQWREKASSRSLVIRPHEEMRANFLGMTAVTRKHVRRDSETETSPWECSGIAEGRQFKRIMPAGQQQNLAFHSRLAHFADDLLRKLGQKGWVVARAHHQHFLRASAHTRYIGKRTDGRPELPQFIGRYTAAQSFPNVGRIHSRAHHVRKICGYVQEYPGAHERLVDRKSTRLNSSHM